MFVFSSRSAVIVLTLVGLLMCSIGGVGVFVTKAPAHPLTIMGYILGLLALFTGIVQVFKLNVPVLGNPDKALIIVAVVIVIKFVIGRLGFLI